MRSAGNFSPDWGYLAPAPSFARTARIVLVATAIGATAGAGVVLSLVDRSTEPKPAPVAAQAIVTSVQAAAAPAAPEIAAPTAPAAAAPPASPPVAAPTATSEASAQPPNHSRAPSQPPDQPAPVPSNEANAPAQAPASVAPAENATPVNAESTNAGPANAGSTPAAGVAALPEPSTTGAVADAPDGGTAAQEPAGLQKKVKHHAYYDRAPFPGLGRFFRRLFVAHAGRSNYSTR